MSALTQRFKQGFRYYNHALVDAMRDFRRWLMTSLFGRPFRTLGSKDLKDIQKILVLRLDRKLGDSIVSTGFLRVLHEHFPKAEITVLTAPETAIVYQTLDFLKVIPVAKGIGPSLKVVRQLKGQVFDVLFDTSNLISPKVIHLAGSLKAHQKIAFKNPKYRLFSHHVEFDEKRDHVTEWYKKALAVIGVQEQDLSYVLKVPQKNKDTVDGVLAEKGSPKIIVVNSFAGIQPHLRSLTEAKLKEVLHALHRSFPEHLLVSVANKGDMNLLKEWKQKGGAPFAWTLFPACTAFFDTCRFIERADFVVSVDTSVVHMACALKKPLVAIYRSDAFPTEERTISWYPYGTKFEMVTSVPRADQKEQNVNDIRGEDVTAAASKVFNSPQNEARV